MKIRIKFKAGEVEAALAREIGDEIYDSTFDPDIEILDIGKDEEGKHWARVKILTPIGEPPNPGRDLL